MQELQETVQNNLSSTNGSELPGLNNAAVELLLLSTLGLKGVFVFQTAMYPLTLTFNDATSRMRATL